MAYKGLSDSERKKILEDIKAKGGFKIWPPPGGHDSECVYFNNGFKDFDINCQCPGGQEYGPTPKQRAGFEIPHEHELDILLVYGGGRGMKSTLGCAVGFDVILNNPKVDTMIGCHEYKHLERTVLNDYKKRLSIHSDWDHPYLLPMGGRPTTHDHTIRLHNMATCYCMHFSDFTILRGANLGFAHIEEASLIKDKSVLGEIIRRMSSTIVKQKRIIITTNPEESHGWIYETFNLKQFESDYKGPPLPIGKPCNCEYCQDCLNDQEDPQVESPEILYKDGFCPRCFDPKNKKSRGRKFSKCPGNQQFWRVILVDPRDNPHLSQSYRQTQKLTTSEAEFNLYTAGHITELRKGFVYSAFARSENVFEVDKPFDYSRDMYWSHDFNINFRSSVINQEWTDPQGVIHSDVVDEIVLPEADPEDAAIELLTRYHDFDNTIYLTFDPSAFNRKYRKDDGGIEVNLMIEVLENPEKYRFPPGDTEKKSPRYPECKPKKVICITKKEEKATKVFVSARVKSTNKMLDDETGFHRLMINPKCRFTIMSLESLKWKEGPGNPVIDVQVDTLAKKRPDKSGIYVLSHPTDALGYYIYKRFPAVPNKAVENYAFLPGVGTVYTDKDGNAVPYSEVKNKDQKPPAEVKVTPPKNPSILELLTRQGAFDEDFDPFAGYFG
jgi:hypothetical protein